MKLKSLLLPRLRRRSEEMTASPIVEEFNQPMVFDLREFFCGIVSDILDRNIPAWA